VTWQLVLELLEVEQEFILKRKEAKKVMVIYSKFTKGVSKTIEATRGN